MTRRDDSQRCATVPSPFSDALRTLADELRLEPLSPARLNRIAARVDRLGRRVHGLGWIRAHEIGGCLTAAVSELSRARERAESDRSEAVRLALRHLEDALSYADEGLQDAEAMAPPAALAGQEVVHGR